MLLPFREHLDFGPTPYDQLQAKEGIPVVRGNVVSDVLELELGRWERMGVASCYLNLAGRQQTDAYPALFTVRGKTMTPCRSRGEPKMQSAKGKALSVNQRMLLKDSLLPAPCAMQKGTEPLPRSGGLASRSPARMNNSGYVCEIPPRGQTLPQRHLFEEIVYIVKGRGATSRCAARARATATTAFATRSGP
jgi:hypothetical protein